MKDDNKQTNNATEKTNSIELVNDLPKEKKDNKDAVKLKQKERDSIIESLQSKALKKKSRHKKVLGFFIFLLIIILIIFGVFMYSKYIKPTIGKSDIKGEVNEPKDTDTVIDKLYKMNYEVVELRLAKKLPSAFELKTPEEKTTYTKNNKEYKTTFESGVYSITVDDETKELLTNVKYVSPIIETKNSNEIIQIAYNNINEVYMLKDDLTSEKSYKFTSVVGEFANLESIKYYTPNNNDYYFFYQVEEDYKYLTSSTDEKISNITLKNIDDIAYIKLSNKMVINKDRTISLDGEDLEQKVLAILLDISDNVGVVVLDDMTVISGSKTTTDKVDRVFENQDGIALLYEDERYTEYKGYKLIK